MSEAAVRTVVLGPLTREEQAAFITAETTDYAAWLVERGDAPDMGAAVARARAEIQPEVAAAVEAREQFWAAHDAHGATVGWLWVKPSEVGLPAAAAFLYQILVRPEFRRRGYGGAMLAALEQFLAAVGYAELRLNVWDTNVAVHRLYARAGYELVQQLPAKRQLRKRLRAAADLGSGGVG
jgi:ribosomal protein S18 acetylase RimI-like enzyme